MVIVLWERVFVLVLNPGVCDASFAGFTVRDMRAVGGEVAFKGVCEVCGKPRGGRYGISSALWWGEARPSRERGKLLAVDSS